MTWEGREERREEGVRDGRKRWRGGWEAANAARARESEYLTRRRVE